MREESAFLYIVSVEITLCFGYSFEEQPPSRQGFRGFANQNFLAKWMFLLCNRMACTLAVFSLLPCNFWTYFLPTSDQFLNCIAEGKQSLWYHPLLVLQLPGIRAEEQGSGVAHQQGNEHWVGSTFCRHQWVHTKASRAAQPALLETALGEVMLPTAFQKEILASAMLSGQGSQAGRQGWARNCPVYSSSSSSVPAAAPSVSPSSCLVVSTAPSSPQPDHSLCSVPFSRANFNVLLLVALPCSILGQNDSETADF